MATSHAIAERIGTIGGAMQPVMRFFPLFAQTLAERPNISNFAVGNPHELPLPAYVQALQRHVVPQNKDWFAYKMNEPEAVQAVVESLRAWRGLAFEPEDIHMTTGAFAAIFASLFALVNPGDEVIMNTPPWFFYEAMIAAVGGVTVRVKVRADNFDLDLDAIEAAITPKTRAILVNSPNNPTGKIYPPETLQALADMLTRASERYGRTIYALSDESYSRIIFDGRSFPSLTAYYPNALLIYTYGKTLLTPGQRIGYIALPPTMPDRPTLNQALFAALFINGYLYPNALLQHALADLDKLSIDIEHLQEKRDRTVSALTDIGYQVHSPEGTFYLLPRSPIADDWAFWQILVDNNILSLPGEVVEQPGYFRLSLTASDAMIDAALPGFARAFAQAKG